MIQNRVRYIKYSILGLFFIFSNYLIGQSEKTQSFPITKSVLDNPVFNQKKNLVEMKYQLQLGAFCKIELKLEKKTKFPVKFRLGSQEVVDKKEYSQELKYKD